MSDESTPLTKPPSEMELLRTEMRAGFQSVTRRFDDVDKRLDGIDSRLDGHDTRFVSLETRIVIEAEETRRHFDVVAEGLGERFKGAIDKTVATDKKVDRLIASNAIEHTAFLGFITDHEVRITRLEGATDQDPQSPAADRKT